MYRDWLEQNDAFEELALVRRIAIQSHRRGRAGAPPGGSSHREPLPRAAGEPCHRTPLPGRGGRDRPRRRRPPQPPSLAAALRSRPRGRGTGDSPQRRTARRRRSHGTGVPLSEPRVRALDSTHNESRGLSNASLVQLPLNRPSQTPRQPRASAGGDALPSPSDWRGRPPTPMPASASWWRPCWTTPFPRCALRSTCCSEPSPRSSGSVARTSPTCCSRARWGGGSLVLRTALGARRGRLILQSIAEITPLVAMGGAFGLLLTTWMLAVAVPWLPDSMPRVEASPSILPVLLSRSPRC